MLVHSRVRRIRQQRGVFSCDGFRDFDKRQESSKVLRVRKIFPHASTVTKVEHKVKDKKDNTCVKNAQIIKYYICRICK